MTHENEKMHTTISTHHDGVVLNNTCVHILNALPMNDSDVTVSCYENVCDGRGH